MKEEFKPNYQEEALLLQSGYRYIAGCDEAGRGAWCGPVVAAAVILPPDINLPWINDVYDSKLLKAGQREALYEKITAQALCWAAGIISHGQIDEVGILNATKRAMLKAVADLSIAPDFLLVDFVRLPIMEIPQKNITKGDLHCLSIACASIVAKVTRDRIMDNLDKQYPGYFLSQHKGYGTKTHMNKIISYGVLPIHRRSFAPIKKRLRYFSGE